MISENFYQVVGEKLRICRKNAGLDQETLSRHLNLSRTSIINIEKGRQRISLEQAWEAAEILGVSISDLLPASQSSSIDEWASKIADAEVGSKAGKNVLEWITKVKTSKKL